MAVCEVIDKAIELEHEERHVLALKVLRKGVDNLQSDSLVYKILMNAMENDTDLSGRSPYTRFIQGYVMGYPQPHMATELIMYTITDSTERKQWKALKERSMLRDACSRGIQREIAMKLR